jgi:NAD(P)-dependent dehydrogenase (short-subunit alcohol dehydrogenase family)
MAWRLAVPRLQDKVALIFGAGCVGTGWGNGRATAVVFGREGARVIAVDKSPDAAEGTAAIIRKEGFECFPITCDVLVADQVKRTVNSCVHQFGRIDVLHNNVGFGSIGGPVETTETDWDRGLNLNLRGVFLTTKYVLPIMEAQRSGVIINISSIASMRWLGTPYVAYAAAKAAVNQFTTVVALQYARKGIRANTVAPGMIDTPLVRAELSDAGADLDTVLAKRDALSPTGKMGTPWDVAYASLFLASNEASYINGVVLPVDGGMTSQVGWSD